VRNGPPPTLIGVLNASPESFSGDGRSRSSAELVDEVGYLIRDGAGMVDVGGESARTDQAPLAPEDELARVVPVIEGIVERFDIPVSVDSYKPEVVEVALRAGASVVNDISGLARPELASLCAEHGARLVIVFNQGTPKVELLESALYDDVVDETLQFMAERIELARGTGLARARIIVDPGPDLAKTPAQTVRILRSLDRLHELGCPILLAVSRKDFIGAITNRPPRERLAGTLAAIEQGVAKGAAYLRVHDVATVRHFLRTRRDLTLG
jgi:dihydropteroate synthase